MKLKIILLFLIVFYPVFCIAAPTFKFTAKIVDSKGNPIEGAEMKVRFTGSNFKLKTGKTDKNGLFTATGKTTTLCNFAVSKEGYYMSGYSFEPMLIKGRSAFGHWQPWNPTIEVVLKEKRNPTRMLARNTYHMEIPVFDTPIGFDLEKGDWVAPYGNGSVKDFIFVFSVSDKNAKPWEEWSCSYKLTFSNKKDGILEYYPPKDNKSEYIWPYEAPETGYKSELTGFRSMKKQPDGSYRKETSYNQERNYIFRVRTKVDSKGNIVEAKYGKIRGDIFIGLKTIRFTYYFNPTGNRSLEYDTANPMLKWSRHELEHKVEEP